MKKNLLPLATLGAVVYGVRVIVDHASRWDTTIAARESVSARQTPDRDERLIPGRRNWRQARLGYGSTARTFDKQEVGGDRFTGEPLPPAKSPPGRPQKFWHDRYQRGIDRQTGRTWVTGTKSQPSQTKRADALWRAFRREHDRVAATHVFSVGSVSYMMGELFNHFNQAGANTQVCDGILVLDPDTPPGALYRRENITCDGEIVSYASWKGAQRKKKPKKPKPEKKQS